MIKNILFALIVLIPTCLSAQSTSYNDATAKKRIESECDGKMFTRVEQLPSFKISKQAFEDTLSQYLKSKNAFYTNKKITFMFVLTKRAEMLELEYISGNTPKENTLSQAFLYYSRLWLPPIQNGHPVCAYVKCDLEFKDDKLSVRVFQ